ncbi:sulfate adenylyltransferase subunit CysD [Ideonella sp. TBM-1]|uniref:Sulfate adenylyltransferase subunit 2 n=2 Tax=Ideonella livida TaxID=2707176 RepID=A0A7C9TM00_9BURK|nr:sulfate adenylyltransferase subunit CysD [Ideonella livida]
MSLSQIHRQTGLSVPTILKAVEAFETGGWGAIEVAGRGRPRGQGRALALAQEVVLRDLALDPAGAVDGPRGLWRAATLQDLAQRRWQTALEPRAAARLLERWGMALQPLRTLASRHGAGAAWLAQAWQAPEASGKAAPLHLWAGALPHPDRPAPAGVLVAVNARGSVAWWPVASLQQVEGYQAFLGRLLADHPEQPLRLHLHGPDFSRVPAMMQWLQAHPQLQCRPGPVAPARRMAPEPRPTPPATAAGATANPSPAAATAAAPPSLRAPAAGAASAPAGAPPAARPAQAPVSLSHPFLHPRTDIPMNLTHLQRLEAESIHIMREVVAEADNPVMLYSIGKDSAVMLHLARKAFYPAPPPFPLLHVDTTWKFRAMYEMRDRMAKEIGMDLLVYHNPEAQEMGINPFDHGSQIHTDMWKTQGLKQALDKYNFDVAFGGARRDEEKSRAKERIFSFRSAQHRWDPKNQRPELWKLYNGRKQKGESIRCFPISNWTELDIWQYIYLENIPIVPLYMAAERPVVDRDGTLIMVDDERFPLRQGEVPMMKSVRFRTLGCYPLSGAVESTASTLKDIIQEMLLTKTSERQGRMIDHDSAASMEKKKQEGYF